MPPNKEGKCDSCNEKSDVLLALWVWDETSCGDMMVEKFYCPACAQIRLELGDDERDEENGEEEDEEENKSG